MLNITNFIDTLLSLTVDKVNWKSILEIQNDPSFCFFYPLNFFGRIGMIRKKASRVRSVHKKLVRVTVTKAIRNFLWPKIFAKKITGAVGSIHSLVGGWTTHLKKYARKGWIISPMFGVNIQNIWNHPPVWKWLFQWFFLIVRVKSYVYSPNFHCINTFQWLDLQCSGQLLGCLGVFPTIPSYSWSISRVKLDLFFDNCNLFKFYIIFQPITSKKPSKLPNKSFLQKRCKKDFFIENTADVSEIRRSPVDSRYCLSHYWRKKSETTSWVW